MDSRKVFALNLRKYMEQKGKSRKDIANELAISYTTVTEWVVGKKYPRIDKIERLAAYFGIKKSDLIESNEMIPMDIGGKIRLARLAKGMTQEELGKRLGVQKSAIAKYESGRVVNIKRSTLRKIPEILDIRPTELIEDLLYEEKPAESELSVPVQALIEEVKMLSDADATALLVALQAKRK